MMTLPCVLDASVGIKLFLNEDDSELVADIFHAHLMYPGALLIAVPGFFYIECASILRKAVKAGKYDVTQARRDLDDLEHMGLHTVSTISLSGQAFEISSIYGASVYDASYVALAARLDVPLVTADERLINCLAGSSYRLSTVTQFFAAMENGEHEVRA
jgi:predicted nucleic acid-binding protein